MKWNVSDLVKAVKGSLVCEKQTGFDSVQIDTRKIHRDQNSCFFALRGAERDGHSYLHSAFEKGAKALVVENLSHTEDLKDSITLIQVSDTRKALSDFSKFWKDKLQFKTSAITGSVGKTSAKHFCQILLKDDPSVQTSPLSYNNDLGLSLSFLQMDGTKKTLIQELGTGSQGEMKKLCDRTQPEIAVCTSVGASHLAGFKHSVENIFKEKNYVYKWAKFGVFNRDNSWTTRMKNHFNNPFVTFSSQNPKENIFLKVSNVGFGFLDIQGHILDKKGFCRLCLAGEHYLTSVMSAVGILLGLGKSPQDIWKVLPDLKHHPDRSSVLELRKGLKIFFDGYNANPLSMEAFLNYMEIANRSQSVVLCLGDMLDLGNRSSFFHEELGRKAGKLNIKCIYFIGKYGMDFEKGLKQSAFKGKCHLLDKYDTVFGQDVFKLLSSYEKKGEEVVLAVKASRGLFLEQLTFDLKKWFE